MIRSPALIVFGFFLSTSALAGPQSSGAALKSCIGHGWEQLQPATVDASLGTCVASADIRVCKRAITPETGNNTSEVSVYRGGIVLTQWQEDGDPAYLQRLYAFRSDRDLLVATLQSESQGMGVQEWSISYMGTSGSSVTRLTTKTAEFGGMGSIVRPSSSSKGHPTCYLLETQWETRPTSKGERLFLRASLRPLTLEGFSSAPQRVFSRRFDHKLERQRQQESEWKPLVFF
jgi:hypothetical protein